MKKIKIENFEYEADEVISFRPPIEIGVAQKNYDRNVNVVFGQFINEFGLRQYKTNKRLWGELYGILQKNKKQKIKCLIIYEDPESLEATQMIKNVVKWGLNNYLHVYRRLGAGRYNEITDENPIFFRGECIASEFVIQEKLNNKPLKDKTKDKLYPKLKYWDIDYPRSEEEWRIAYAQVKFYIENRIPPAYDKNRYTLCKECKDLYTRGVEHVCYAPEYIKYTQLDYEINPGLLKNE